MTFMGPFLSPCKMLSSFKNEGCDIPQNAVCPGTRVPAAPNGSTITSRESGQPLHLENSFLFAALLMNLLTTLLNADLRLCIRDTEFFMKTMKSEDKNTKVRPAKNLIKRRVSGQSWGQKEENPAVGPQGSEDYFLSG